MPFGVRVERQHLKLLQVVEVVSKHFFVMQKLLLKLLHNFFFTVLVLAIIFISHQINYQINWGFFLLQFQLLRCLMFTISIGLFVCRFLGLMLFALSECVSRGLLVLFLLLEDWLVEFEGVVEFHGLILHPFWLFLHIPFICGVNLL